MHAYKYTYVCEQQIVHVNFHTVCMYKVRMPQEKYLWM